MSLPRHAAGHEELKDCESCIWQSVGILVPAGNCIHPMDGKGKPDEKHGGQDCKRWEGWDD